MNHPARLTENGSLTLRDQVQLALALSDRQRLQQLLTDSWPAVATPQTIGTLYAEVSPAIGEGVTLDGLLHFEHIHCRLAEANAALPDPLEVADQAHYQALTRCQSALHTLAKDVALSEAIALLSHAGFAAEPISQILNLPTDAWYKSWWVITDHPFSQQIPFLRLIRSRRYSDGTFTLQYADRYSCDPPKAFRGHSVDIPIVIRDPQSGFGATLAQVNTARRITHSHQAILIADDNPSELEIEGFQRQGVSLFTAQQLHPPVAASCQCCNRQQCPLVGQVQSLVTHCRGFLARAEVDRTAGSAD